MIVTRRAYTLVEMLIATTLTLIMMAGVASVFGMIGTSISSARAALEMAEALRATSQRLSADLAGATATMSPPRRPEDNEGYFQYTEGAIGPVRSPEEVATNVDTGLPDTTVGDTDDMLMFTTRSHAEPFVGRTFVKRACGATETPTGNDGANFVIINTAESQDAEVAYFVRGNTLYRRMLLIRPQHDADLRTAAVEMQLDSRRQPPGYNGAGNPPYPVVAMAGPGFFRDYDLSVRMENGTLALNTLADLTKPRNRFAHQHLNRDAAGNLTVSYPFHPHFMVDWQAVYSEVNTNGTNPALAYDAFAQRSVWASLGLPTLCECSYIYPTNPAIDLVTTSSPFVANCLNSWVAGGGEMGDTTQWPGHLPITNNLWAAFVPAFNATYPATVDAWLSQYAVGQCNVDTGALALQQITPLPLGGGAASRYQGSRIAEDAILKNVIEFDVKAWDPNAPIMRMWNTQGTPALTDDTVAAIIMPGDRDYIRALYLRDNLDPDTAGHPNTRYDIAGFGAYVDLNYLCRLGPWNWNGTAENVDPAYPSQLPIYQDSANNRAPTQFGNAGDYRSGLRGTRPSPRYRPAIDGNLSAPIAAYRGPLRSAVYDTWSVHYESDGIQEGSSWYPTGGNPPWAQLPVDAGANGFDNDGDGIVDNLAEQEAPPPYSAPLRGIQIKIRVFDPDSRQIRDVTIIHDFLPK